MRILLLACLLCLQAFQGLARAQQNESNTSELIPQNLLGLVHAPEVYQELGLSDQQTRQLEGLFAAIDGDWFRARITPAAEQRATIAGLEQRVRLWFSQNTTPEQQQRLQQIELQSLGMRMLLRPDIASRLKLDAGQQATLLQLAEKVNATAEEFLNASRNNKSTEEQKQAVAAAAQAEQQALKTVVQPEQLQLLKQLLGKTFDTMQLKRIYPMAPEFVPVEDWINSDPLTLKELRGKVVLVHFYAFQCHNCHANFPHYKKWHEEFPEDEVVVIGIQTPETPRERDPAAVRAAATERAMEYPILIDLESKNWGAWANTMWPTVYVIDKQGYLRHWWQGELNWQGATFDKTIHELVKNLIQEQS